MPDYLCKTNGYEPPILRQNAIHIWGLYAIGSDGKSLKTGFLRGTYREANSKAARLAVEQGCISHFLRIGK